MSVKIRLISLLVASLAALALSAAINVHFLGKLAQLQDEGFGKTQTQAAAAEASWLGAQYYQIIADAIINRDLAEAKAQIARLHDEAASDLQKLGAAADTAAEKKAVADAREAVGRIEQRFERLIVVLGSNNTVADEIRRLDAEFDQDVDTVRDQLSLVAKSMAAEATTADREFDITRGEPCAMSASSVQLPL